MDSLGAVFREHENKNGLRDICLAGALAPRWWEIVGKEIAEKTSPIRISDKTLLIRTTSPGWSHQLSLMKTSIVEKLNERGFEIVDLRFVFKEKTDEKPKKKSRPLKSRPDFSGVPETINTEKLRVAIASYMGARKANAKQRNAQLGVVD